MHLDGWYSLDHMVARSFVAETGETFEQNFAVALVLFSALRTLWEMQHVDARKVFAGLIEHIVSIQ